MSEPFVGEICCFGFNFAPRDWAQCNGQLVGISQNTPLFTIIGTTYGGDGQVTFALPNLQGQVPMHWGTGRNGNVTDIGEVMGQANVTLNIMNLPMHNHVINTAETKAVSQRTAEPSNASYFSQIKGGLLYAQNQPMNAIFSPMAIAPYGSSGAHENMQPYLTLNFCIALYGVYPTRN